MSNDTKLILEEIRKVETRLREEIKMTETTLREEMKAQGETLREEIKMTESTLREEMKAQEVSLRQEIRDGDNAIRLILENDIRPKINILAEGHLDLNRKLDEIKAGMKKYELLPVRVSILERDVREIKQQLAMKA